MCNFWCLRVKFTEGFKLNNSVGSIETFTEIEMYNLDYETLKDQYVHTRVTNTSLFILVVKTVDP